MLEELDRIVATLLKVWKGTGWQRMFVCVSASSVRAKYPNSGKVCMWALVGMAEPIFRVGHVLLPMRDNVPSHSDLG